MTKIEQIINPITGEVEVFLNGKRLESLLDDQTNIQLETLKNLLDIQEGDASLASIKDVLLDIYNRIGDEQGEAMDKLKKELLILIQLLDQKIEENKLVAGEGIVIDGNVISTTNGSYLDKLISDYEKLQNEYNKLLAQNKKLEGKVSVLNNRLERCSQENQRLTNELKQMTLQYEQTLAEIAKFNSEIKRLEEIIASGTDYKLYKKYQQLCYQTEAEAAKYKNALDELTGVNKYRKSQDKELANRLKKECCFCC